MTPPIINDIYIVKRNGSIISLRFVSRNNHLTHTLIYLDGILRYDGHDNEINLDLGQDGAILNKQLDVYSTIQKTSPSDIQCDLYLNGGTTPRHWKASSQNPLDRFVAHIVIV